MDKMLRLNHTAVLMAVMALASCAAAQTLETLYSFNGPPIESGPQSPLVIGSGGVLYGTTYNGGSGNWGTVFSLTPPAVTDGAWTYTLLYTFTNGSDGACPVALVRAANSVLYGLTSGCTENGYFPYAGMAFSLTPPSIASGAWTETTIYDFAAGSQNISQPNSLALIGGTLYGTSLWGGTSSACYGGCGAIFSLTPEGQTSTANVLFSFPGPAPNQNPLDLIAGPAGSLYGMASACDIGPGDPGCGEVFQLTPPSSTGDSWKETVLYFFTNRNADGQGWGGIALGGGGVIYGTTNGGGYMQRGTVFALTPPTAPGRAWTESVLHKFGHGADGYSPNAYLTIGQDGVLYGTTNEGGGASGCACGVVFAVVPPSRPDGIWTERVLYNFSTASGGIPATGLTIAADRILYGTTTSNGEFGEGTVFALKP